MTSYADATYALVITWAVGTALTVAIADTEMGMIRDHPLYGRRLAGRVVPLMALVGLLSPFLLPGRRGPLPSTWILVSIPLMLPFAWLSWRWSRTWIGRWPAARRRQSGIWAVVAGILGLIPSTLLSIYGLDPAWRGVVPMAIFTAGIALPGSLTNFTILALTAGLPAEVPAGPAQGMAEVAGGGLLINLLVLLDVVSTWFQTGSTWPAGARWLVVGWQACAVAVPGLILLLRLVWRKMPDAWFMPVALGFALAGQWMAYLLIFQFPGLVPPVEWS